MERKLYSLEAINSNNKADRCVIKIKIIMVSMNKSRI